MLRICSVIVLLLSPVLGHAGPSGTVKVIDGDTIDVGSTRVRLFGIDTPEPGQTCKIEGNVEWPCGDWVSSQVRKSFGGSQAVCNVLDQDKYGRVVGQCFVDGKDIGAAIVAAGWAEAYRKYSLNYVAIEDAARRAQRGVWAGWMVSPATHRVTRVKGRIAPDPGCAIKGNISAGGRIYHKPGGHHYDRTGISPEKGERWFCSETDAKQAGWRAALR